VEPVEIGQLFRLFFYENYPKMISDQDRYLIVLDSQERIIGGICYKRIDENIAQLDGTVVASFLKERGIGSAMIEDFCNRMASQGIQIIKTHFFIPQFFIKLGFKVDQRWGALVKFLTPKNVKEDIITDDLIQK
jgi:predicted GNAT family acetyltransferase